MLFNSKQGVVVVLKQSDWLIYVLALCYAAPYGFGMMKTTFSSEYVQVPVDENDPNCTIFFLLVFIKHPATCGQGV